MSSVLSSTYFAAFSTRENELRGYSKLSKELSSNFTPVVSINRYQSAPSLDAALEAIDKETEQHHYILDVIPHRVVTSDEKKAIQEKLGRYKSKVIPISSPKKELSANAKAHHERVKAKTKSYNDHLASILDRQNSFKNWIEFASRSKNGIPVILTQNASSDDIYNQGALLLDRKGHVIFRLRSEQAALAAIKALKAYGSSDNATIIIDLGQSPRVEGAAISAFLGVFGFIQQKLSPTELSKMRFVFMTNSFPSSVRASLPNLSPSAALQPIPERIRKGSLKIIERTAYDTVKKWGNIIYGDHSSIHVPTQQKLGGTSKFCPHIELVTPMVWNFAVSEQKGSADYVEVAKQIRTDVKFWAQKTDCWGTQVIDDVSNASCTTASELNGFRKPGDWMAVRINQHLSAFAISHPR